MRSISLTALMITILGTPFITWAQPEGTPTSSPCGQGPHFQPPRQPGLAPNLEGSLLSARDRVALAQVTGGAKVGQAKGIKSIRDDEAWKKNQQELIRKANAETPGRVTYGFRVIEEPGVESYRDCVCVLYRNTNETGCTGTLVGKNVVVTCGHGVKRHGGFDRVFIGLDVNSPTPGDEFIKIKTVIQHSNYKEDKQPGSGYRQLVNDLTVLILERNAAAIPRVIACRNDVESANYVRVVGFGAGDLIDGFLPTGFGIKRHVRVPIATSACERKKNGSDGTDDADCYGCLVGKELVASDPLRKADSCNGDSGGPAYIEVKGEYYLAAALSRAMKLPPAAENARLCGDGAIYVRIDKYKEWIEQTAKENGGIMP